MPKGVPNKRYTGEFKQLVVETMMRDKLSYREAARQFEVPDHKDVAKWERYYLMDGPEGLYIERVTEQCLLSACAMNLIRLVKAANAVFFFA